MSDEPDDLEEFAYLWDGSEPGWVLIEGSSLPVNKQTRIMMLIEDDVLAKRVCQQMLDRGCEVLKEVPKGPWNPPGE